MKKPYLLICLIIITGLLAAQTSSTPYAFFIAGHTYGQPGVDNEGLHPPFKQKFAYIQGRPEIQFGVFTGDIVSPNSTAEDWDEVDADVDLLGLPVYFAAGNHDVEDRALFESRYGDTYYFFTWQNDLFIVLDPNLDEWNISGDQLTFLQDVVENHTPDTGNIFVLFHQLLWWEEDNIYKDIQPNSLAGRADTINFWQAVEPLFHQLTNRVVFCAGDMGAVPWSDDFMYDAYDNIEFVCSGMGDYSGDNFVVINVGADKAIDYDLICLNDSTLECFGELTDYRITLGMENQPDAKVLMYPNPATSLVTISSDEKNIGKVQLFDIKGRLILQTDSGHLQTLDVARLPKGMYFVKISTDGLSVMKKLIIQ